jgi:four helix bundle protein
MQIKSAKDLIVYNKAYALAMQIFDVSQDWPRAEKYALTDQIRRADL